MDVTQPVTSREPLDRAGGTARTSRAGSDGDDECGRHEHTDRLGPPLRSGVPTELHLYPGTFHASIAVADAAVPVRMTADLVAALRRALH